MPEGALGEHHPVGEDGPLVVDPVCIPVFKSEDTVGPLLELLFYLLVAAGRVADIEVALLVQAAVIGRLQSPGTQAASMENPSGRVNPWDPMRCWPVAADAVSRKKAMKNIL